MKMIVNDAYAKDISMKVTTGKRQAMKKGHRVGGNPGFGYMRNPERPWENILDPEAAAIVRKVFDMALAGLRPFEIANALNRDGVETPSGYLRKKHPDSNRCRNFAENRKWTGGIVRPILKRFAYTGASVGHVTQMRNPCKKGIKHLPKEEWVIVPGLHEAIVSEEEYALAQGVIKGRPRPERRELEYPLKSLVFCGNCGRRMSRHRRGWFFCPYGGNGVDEGCAGLKAKTAEMEKAVFESIQNFIRLAENEGKSNRHRAGKQKEVLQEASGRIAVLEKEIEALRQKKLSAYEHYCEGRTDREEYLCQKKELDEEIRMNEELLERQRAMANPVKRGEERPSASEQSAACETFRDAESLTYAIAHAFVEKVIIYPGNRMEIKMKFKDPIISGEEVT